jgi:hypothetical protein
MLRALGEPWREIGTSGFASGESLVMSLAEGDEARRLVFEAELAALFARCRREGSTLSAVMRDLWDGRPAAHRRVNRSVVAPRHHVGALGHITPEELRRTLPATEIFNGFANRWLYMLTHRARILPYGGQLLADDDYLDDLAKRVRDQIALARSVARVDITDAAKLVWEPFVAEVLTRPQGGLAGAAIARSRANTLRLAVTFALADGTALIYPEHVRAAVAVWDYSEASARLIFGESTGDPLADRLYGPLVEAGAVGLTREQQRATLGHNYPANRLDEVVAALVRMGLATVSRRPTGGRLADVLVASDHGGDSSLSSLPPTPPEGWGEWREVE